VNDPIEYEKRTDVMISLANQRAENERQNAEARVKVAEIEAKSRLEVADKIAAAMGKLGDALRYLGRRQG